MALPPRPDGSSAPDENPAAPDDPATLRNERLIRAARAGNEEDVRLCLRGGADINFAEPSTGLTALHYAAAYDTVGMLRLIARDPACDFTVKDRKGRTAATLAYEVAENSITGRFLLTKEMRQRRDRAAQDQSSA